MSVKEPVVDNENIIEFDEKKFIHDAKKMFGHITKESKDLHTKIRKKITSMYIITLLLYGKPIEITTIENLSCDLHDQFSEVRNNLPELPQRIIHAMNLADHLRRKGFSEIPKDEFVNTFNILIEMFKNKVSDYIDANFENINVTVFIESDSELSSDIALESYAEENNIDENDIDDEKREEISTKAYNQNKVKMIKEFISTIL